MRRLTQKYLKGLTYEIIGAAIEVHKDLGPGLLEQVYETCLCYELRNKGIDFKRQERVTIDYKEITLEAELRYDLLVEDCIVVELKAVKELHPIYEAQTMTYARLMEQPKAILINFMCKNIYHEGQKTFVTEYFRFLPPE